MSDIKINNDIRPVDSPVFLISPEGEVIGEIKTNEAFLDVRLQICENNLEGYKIRFKNRDLLIKSNGKLEKYPYGLFDRQEDYLSKMARLTLNLS